VHCSQAICAFLPCKATRASWQSGFGASSLTSCGGIREQRNAYVGQVWMATRDLINPANRSYQMIDEGKYRE
jgi:hypothetical protein